VLFAIGVVLIRPVVLYLTLAGLKLDRRSKLLISWFGPRGLSTLLLMLIPIFAGTPGVRELFPICCLVVLMSVFVHGATQMLVGRKPLADDESKEADEDVVITVERMQELQKNGEDVVVLDVRKDSAMDGQSAKESIRISPAHPVDEVAERKLSKDSWLIAFCA
jgi:NhaP-type Na+/H+ and K+/H+ antiporter